MARYGDPQAQRTVDDALDVFNNPSASTEQLRTALGAALTLYADACTTIGDLLIGPLTERQGVDVNRACG